MAKYNQVATQEQQLRKGPWLEEEDKQLADFVTLLGERKWDSIAKASGLRRSGKSCRMRWLNYLRPNIKRGHISAEEEQLIVQLHKQWGNKWSRIAQRLPGRTDNEIKNYWRTHLRKKLLPKDQEGEIQWKLHDIAKPDVLHLRDESISYQGTADFNTDRYELSCFTCMNSPYEARLLRDWMIGLNNNSELVNINHEAIGFDDLDSYLSWNSDDSDDTIVLGYSDSLWNMN